MNNNNNQENIHYINIFNHKISYLSIIIFICGLILSIVYYVTNKDITNTSLIIFTYLAIVHNINCMLLGNCWINSTLIIILYIVLTIMILIDLTKVDEFLNSSNFINLFKIKLH